MRTCWDRVRFAASLPTDDGRPTLASDVRIWDVTVEVSNVPDDPESVAELERWLDVTFPHRSELVPGEPPEEHDCPSCRCWERDVPWSFTAPLPAHDRGELVRAVAELRVRDAQAVAA